METVFLLVGLVALLSVTDMFISNSDTDSEPLERADEDDLLSDDDTRSNLLDGADGQAMPDFDATQPEMDLAALDDSMVMEMLGLVDAEVSDPSSFIVTAPDFGAETTDWPVVDNFDPAQDELVLDLRDADLGGAGTSENPLVLTGTAAPDGNGLMVQVNGQNFLQIANYGGDDMQFALEALEIEVLGAEAVFPDDLDDDLAMLLGDSPEGIAAHPR